MTEITIQYKMGSQIQYLISDHSTMATTTTADQATATRRQSARTPNTHQSLSSPGVALLVAALPVLYLLSEHSSNVSSGGRSSASASLVLGLVAGNESGDMGVSSNMVEHVEKPLGDLSFFMLPSSSLSGDGIFVMSGIADSAAPNRAEPRRM